MRRLRLGRLSKLAQIPRQSRDSNPGMSDVKVSVLTILLLHVPDEKQKFKIQRPQLFLLAGRLEYQS
jgi:hypothetical protein